MLRSIVSNHNIEKIELLPDDIMLYVNRNWCNSSLARLREYEYYGELIDRLDYLLSLRNNDTRGNYPNPRYILLSAGDIKKLVSLCGGETLCCNFPYNYDEIAMHFLDDTLGVFKLEIEIMMDKNMIGDILMMIDNLEDEYLMMLSLIYVKYLYNKKMDAMIEEINVSKRKVLGLINGKLYWFLVLVF